MTVQPLIQLLAALPEQAAVLLESDHGDSALGGVSWVRGAGAAPDEIVLQPDMAPD
jgi:hypothetical protein